MAETTPGQRIAALRQRKSWTRKRKYTQQELAAEVGVHAGTVAAWEGGKQLPEGSNLLRLAEVLGVTVSYILRGAEGPTLPGLRGTGTGTVQGTAEDTARAGDHAEATVLPAEYPLLSPDAVMKQLRRIDEREANEAEARALKLDYLENVRGVLWHHGQNPGWLARYEREIRESS